MSEHFLEYLSIKDFMKHRSTVVDCTMFQSVLILGKFKNNPRKSNGCGKTTILHAIRYLLFGTTPEEDGKKLKVDDLVRLGANFCEVSGIFNVKIGKIRITRSRYKKAERSDLKLEQFIGDNWVNKDQLTPTQTQQEIIKILGFNDDCFKHCCHVKQSKISDIISSNSGERLKILKDVLILNIYSKLERLSRDKNSIINKEINVLNQFIKNLGSPKEELDRFNLDLIKINKDIDNIIEKIRIINENIVKNTSELQDLQKLNQNDILQQLKSLSAKENDLLSKIKKENYDLISLNKSLNESNEKYQSYSKDLEKLKNELSSLNDNSISIVNINNQINDLNQKEFKGVSLISKLEQQLKTLQQFSLNPGNCSQCFQLVEQDHCAKLQEKNKNNVKIVELDLTKFKNTLLALRERKNQLQIDLRKANDKCDRINWLKSKIELKNSEVYGFQGSIVSIQADIKRRNQNLQDLQIELSDIQKNKKDLELVSNSSDVEEQMLLKQQLIQKFNQELKQKEDIKIVLYTNLGILKSKIEQKEKDLQKLNEYQEELKILQQKDKIRHLLSFAYGPTGIPAQTIHGILDPWQNKTNELLLQLDSTLQIKFSPTKVVNDVEQDSFDIIFYKNNEQFALEALAGSYKFLFSLSLIRGLGLTLESLLDIKLGIIELDEVDQSLDLENVDSYINIVKTWQKDVQIFAITHNEYLKDKFSHAILIEGDDENGSVGSLVAN